MEKLESRWVKDWKTKDIIGCAVSLGMEFQTMETPAEILNYNKKILTKEIKRRINGKTNPKI